MNKKIIFFSIIVTAALASCTSEKGEVPSLGCGVMSYSTDIQPIIAAKCATSGCHVAGGTGVGDFSTYTDLKAKVDGGQINNRVYQVKDMPPAGNPQLSQDELDRLKCWIQQGAQNN